MMKKEKTNQNIHILNRRAHHEYFIEETYQAGLMLTGTEVKSIRNGQASITEAFCKTENGEVWIYGMHIAPYEQGNRANLDPIRKRKLLLNAYEIVKIDKVISEKGLTLIPLKLYFSRGYAKLDIGIAKGKKLWDKRDSIASKDVEREKQRSMSEKY